ncbi:O-antigen ligase family protein [Candidatus Microgenomates bacterium]|nr:O-antigen ligase family protein [Candidatus Microgenomates bacterium]
MNSQKIIPPLHSKLFWLLILLLPTQLGFHFWPSFATVFGIRVDYLAPTVYLTDILVVGVIVTWWWEGRKVIVKLLHGYMAKISTIQPFNHATIFFFITIFYLLITSLFVAHNSGAALYKLVKLIEFTLFGFYVFANYKLLITNHNFFIPLSIALIYSSLIAWGQFALQHTLGGLFWFLGERTFDANTPGIALININGQDLLRPYATFPHPNVLAGFLLVALILIPQKQKTIQPFNRLIILLGLSAFILTFSHSAWIAGIIVLLISGINYLRNKTNGLVKLILAVVTIISLVLPSLNIPPNAPTEIAQRMILASASWEMFKDFPLTGVGLNNFIVRLPEYGSQPSVSWLLQPVHNIYLLVLSETGVIGFALFLWFIFKVIQKFSVVLLVIILIGIADHYWLTLQQTQLFFSILLGLALSKAHS